MNIFYKFLPSFFITFEIFDDGYISSQCLQHYRLGITYSLLMVSWCVFAVYNNYVLCGELILAHNIP